MRNIITMLLFILLMNFAFAQDFNKNLATAKSSYSSGKLEDSRFAMQQMLNDIDIMVGKEILTLLPQKFDAMAVNAKNDNVTANTGIAGVLIHRDYGTGEKTATIDFMGNSPLVASLNTMLTLPMMGNSGDGTQKIIKVHGYKGILQKSVDTETNKTDYTLQVPVGSTLMTLAVPNSTEGDVTKFANAIPLPDIAKKVQ